MVTFSSSGERRYTKPEEIYNPNSAAYRSKIDIPSKGLQQPDHAKVLELIEQIMSQPNVGAPKRREKLRAAAGALMLIAAGAAVGMGGKIVYENKFSPKIEQATEKIVDDTVELNIDPTATTLQKIDTSNAAPISTSTIQSSLTTSVNTKTDINAAKGQVCIPTKLKMTKADGSVVPINGIQVCAMPEFTTYDNKWNTITNIGIQFQIGDSGSLIETIQKTTGKTITLPTALDAMRKSINAAGPQCISDRESLIHGAFSTVSSDQPNAVKPDNSKVNVQWLDNNNEPSGESWRCS